MRPFIAYRGGKSRLANKIAKKIPPHETYVEAMVGGGSVYFVKQPARYAVISDVDPSLMNFYKGLKAGRISRCNLKPNKQRLERIKKRRSRCNTKSRKCKPLSACDYLYLNKLSFGGTGTSFSKTRFEKCKGKDARKCGIKSKKLDAYQQRMKRTRVETGDFRDKIRKYDSKGTFFYLDPPYAETNRSGYIDKSLTVEQVKAGLDQIRKAKFLLSYKDTPRNRKILCDEYKCERVKTTYSMSNKGMRKDIKELLVKNY